MGGELERGVGVELAWMMVVMIAAGVTYEAWIVCQAAGPHLARTAGCKAG